MVRLFYFCLMRLTLSLFLLILLCACQNKEGNTDQMPEDPLFRLVSPDQSGVDFINEVQDQEDFNVLTYRNYYNGGGIAIGDINNDGNADLYFTANMASNKLYLNQGNLQFEDITDQAGVQGSMAWSTGVTMADVNGDGWLDIYVCNSGDVTGDKKENELYINNHDNTFTEKASVYGLDDDGYSTHASFFDYDRDGDLDMYLVNNSFKDAGRIDFKNVRNERNSHGGDKLFRNDNNVFTDVSESSRIYGSEIGFGLGVSVSDINGDYWPDIYISNDFWERDYLYINNQDGTFNEDLTNRMPMTSTASMGADVADIDNNGSFEIFSTDMLPATNQRLKRTTIFNNYNLEDLRYRNDYHYQYTQNCLQLNDGTGHFKEIANLTGVAATDWSWGALIFDFDNDGLKDIFVSNGVYHDITDMDFSDFIEDQQEVEKVVREKGRFDFRDFLEFLPSTKISNYAFVNKGNLNFDNQARTLGLGMASFSNGSIYGDLDNDGDLDLVLNNVNMPAHIYENTTEQSGNNYISVQLISQTANRFAIGATVEVITRDRTIYKQNYQSRGFQSATEPILTVGIGQDNSISAIKVNWPGGNCTMLKDIGINQRITIAEDEGIPCATDEEEDSAPVSPLFEEVVNSSFGSIHNENTYNDFDREPLMPRMVSTEGPEVLVGDLNADDLDDYILLGATGDADKVFMQQRSGSFRLVNQPALSGGDKAYESTCGLLIDLDVDGDLDLMIGSGGNDPSFQYEDYVLRIYVNNGKGQFTRDESSALKALGNFSVIEAIQLTPDHRGIFVGGRIVPGNYGLDPRNFYFVEVSPGQWKEATTQETGLIGMVTDAKAIDIDGDNDEDLVVVGEWIPIILFENQDGNLRKKSEVAGTGGLWQSISLADLDNDGREDLIVGNWGANSKFQASADRPLSMYVSDFDQNKKSECIIEWYAPEDKEATLFASKNDLTGQLPSLKKIILKNYDYSNTTLTDLFSRAQLNKSLKKQVVTLQTSVLMNRGNFSFDVVPLNKKAQFAPVFSILARDVNDDGLQDLILGGNMYGLKPEVGRLDSSRGLVLINSGDGNFKTLDKETSGIFIRGEIRSIQSMKLGQSQDAIIVGINNAETRIFKIRANG